jgi:hypothetical protein
MRKRFPMQEVIMGNVLPAGLGQATAIPLERMNGYREARRHGQPH